jgi:hypothetical protein
MASRKHSGSKKAKSPKRASGSRKATEYNAYMKAALSAYKKKHTSAKHRSAFKKVANRWHAVKDLAGGAPARAKKAVAMSVTPPRRSSSPKKGKRKSGGSRKSSGSRKRKSGGSRKSSGSRKRKSGGSRKSSGSRKRKSGGSRKPRAKKA